MTNAKIVNCKTASIRRNPMNPREDEDILVTLKLSEKIKVETSIKVFDWKDNSFYRCDTDFGEGFVRTELVEEI